MASGTLPISYQWQFNGVNLAGEVNDVLTIPAVAFEQEGRYKVVATNAFGSADSNEAQLAVGALFSELFHTGQDVNLAVLPGDSNDLHYGLLESPDVNNLGPKAKVWSDAYPVPVFVWNGPVSSWISAVGNDGTVPGKYVYRTQFLIDSADPCTAVLQGNWMLNTTGDDIVLNGQSTGIKNTSELPYKVAESFTINQGFVAGLNTLDFVVTNTGVTPPNMSASFTGLRVNSRRGQRCRRACRRSSPSLKAARFAGGQDLPVGDRVGPAAAVLSVALSTISPGGPECNSSDTAVECRRCRLGGPLYGRGYQRIRLCNQRGGRGDG